MWCCIVGYSAPNTQEGNAYFNFSSRQPTSDSAHSTLEDEGTTILWNVSSHLPTDTPITSQKAQTLITTGVKTSTDTTTLMFIFSSQNLVIYCTFLYLSDKE